jgi:hypothetical protein
VDTGHRRRTGGPAAPALSSLVRGLSERNLLALNQLATAL